VDFTNLLVPLICGAVGGNLAAGAIPQRSLGIVGNSLAGIFGVGIGGSLLHALGLFATLDAGGGLGSILGQVASGGVGGVVVLLAVALVKGALSKA